MSVYPMGVGVGVIVISVVWIIAIFSALIFSRVKRPTSYLGGGSLLVALLVTVILLSIPRNSDTAKPEPKQLPEDYLFIWRTTLLVFVFLTLVIALALMVSEHWAVVVTAKPLKKAILKTTILSS